MFGRRRQKPELLPLAEGEKQAGHMGIRLHAVDDPYLTEVINGHVSFEYCAGYERLLALDLEVRNLSTYEELSVSTTRFHLIDDQSFMHDSLGLDSRNKEPRLLETPLPPGLGVRGWVTFALACERQAIRLQAFTGYLSGRIAVLELPVLSAEDWQRHIATTEGFQPKSDEERAEAERHAAIMGYRRRTPARETRRGRLVRIVQRATESRSDGPPDAADQGYEN